MQPLTLTKHFTQRWMERVGNWPTVEAVRNYLSQSVMVQRCEDVVRMDGRHYRVLAIYWHPQLDLVMKVDTMDNSAVTVISRNGCAKRTIPPAQPVSAPIEPDEPETEAYRPAPVPQGLMDRVARVREMFGARWTRRKVCQS